MDAQSTDRPRLYVEKAGVTFTTLVDQANILSDLYGFKAVPNGFLIDEQGIVRFSQLGGFDIGQPETAEVLEGNGCRGKPTSQPAWDRNPS